MRRIFLHILMILISVFLVSCRYTTCYLDDRYQSRQWNKNKGLLLNIINYEVRGIVICSFYEKKKVRFHFFFQNIACNRYRLVFSDPIGYNNVEINMLQDGKLSINGNLSNLSLYNFSQIIQKLINDHVFLKNFREWIIGLPGTVDNFTINAAGFLKKINYQYNKKIFVVSYKSYYSSKVPHLPKVLSIYYNKNICFDIRIYKWVT